MTGTRATSFNRDYLDLAFAAQHGHADIVRMTLEAQVDTRVADGEMGELNPFHGARQLRTCERNSPRSRIDAQSKRRREQQMHRARRPCLW
jgi:hypothetical protein